MAFFTPYTALLDWFTQHGDPRVESWPLMSSPLPTALICLTYVFVVKVVGPVGMRNRPPYQLRLPLILYNGLQVLFSAWLFYEYGRGGWFHGYSFTCQPVDYTQSEMGIRMAHVCWWYYLSKFTEFFDTFFFILRKKERQVSGLHVIHHGLMPLSVWFGVKLTPGGHSTFFGLLNTLVHVIMYTYYLLAAMGPAVSPYLWWKRYLTGIQMVQFVLIAVHAFQLLFKQDCNYPIAFVWWIGCHGLLFLVLFSRFYKDSYRPGKTPALSKAGGVHHDKESSNGATTEAADRVIHNKLGFEEVGEGEWGRGLISNGTQKRSIYKGH